jgi:hypothetical protein
MKLIECTPKPTEESPLQKIMEQVRERLPFLADVEQKAQEMVQARFAYNLDNHHILLHSVRLAELGDIIPFVLVGPFGIAVLNISAEKGVYKAKEESWFELNKTTRKFQAAPKNLIKQTQAFAQAVAALLDRQGKPHPEIVPNLIFTHPGVHIDSSRPAVKLVLMDGIDHLISTFMTGGETLQLIEVKAIAEAIDRIANPQAAKPVVEEDIFGKDLGLVKPEKPAPKAPRPVPQLNLPPFLNKLNFSKRQWILLLVISLFTMLVLMGLIVLVLFTAG